MKLMLYQATFSNLRGWYRSPCSDCAIGSTIAWMRNRNANVLAAWGTPAILRYGGFTSGFPLYSKANLQTQVGEHQGLV